jgi:two-component system nitrate/nitrite sensor histidine kinase NarX
MARLVERSLLLRLGLLMATITVLAVTGMGVSVVVAEMLNGQAAAINQAGSLRMQSYIVLSRALAAQGQDAASHRAAVAEARHQFAGRLTSPRLTEIVPNDPSDPIGAAYREVSDIWQEQCEPLLDAYLDVQAATIEAGSADAGDERGSVDLRDRTMAAIDRFVQRIDHMVSLLEEDTESTVRLLRAVQGVTLFLTLVVVLVTMYFMQTDVLTPLSDLLACAASARGGDFARRARHVGEDELGRLGHAFNVMAEDLSKLYTGLEQRVAERTTELRRSNRSLELLYHTLTRLSEAPLSEQSYQALLQEIGDVLGLPGGTVCLAGERRDQAYVRASTFLGPGNPHPPGCTAPLCAECLGATASRLRRVGGARLLSVPLRGPDASYGAMNLAVPEGATVARWQLQLADAVGRHVGMALANAERNAQARRMALLEERAAIARELHDSLAQSLSYLKIQVTRLRTLLGREGGPRGGEAVVEELREGVSGAYRQLRELLTTFRIQIDGRGLGHALEETVRELGGRTETRVTLDNRLGPCLLDPHEEVHVLQVVREALTNVVRHASAANARVALSCEGQNAVAVTIEDDGVGIAPDSGRRHHYGLAIMRERAQTLGGELRIESRAGGGTLVVLSFTPAAAAPSRNGAGPPPPGGKTPR